MNEFENGFHNENLENNRINNQENNSQQVAIDVTPIEESVTMEIIATILIIILIAATDGEMRVLIIMKIIMGISRRNLIRDADRERMAVKIIRTEWVRKPPS